MYQNQGRVPEPCSEVLSSDGFIMPKIVSKCPMSDHVIWHITYGCLLECFKMPKIVSKCPKFVIWLLDHHNYTTLVCFACLTYNMDRFDKRIATPIVVCDVNLTYHNYSWQQLEWSHVVLTPPTTGVGTRWGMGTWSRSPTLAADVSVTNIVCIDIWRVVLL